MTSAGHRTVPGRRLHTSDDICLKFISYDSNGARPGTVRAPGTFKYLLTNRPMPVRAPDDARPGTGRCRTATGEKRRVFAEEHIAFTEIFYF